MTRSLLGKAREPAPGMHAVTCVAAVCGPGLSNLLAWVAVAAQSAESFLAVAGHRSITFHRSNAEPPWCAFIGRRRAVLVCGGLKRRPRRVPRHPLVLRNVPAQARPLHQGLPALPRPSRRGAACAADVRPARLSCPRHAAAQHPAGTRRLSLRNGKREFYALNRSVCAMLW